MSPNLFWKFKILKKALLRPAGPGIRNSPGPEKRCRTCGAVFELLQFQVFELLQILNSNLDFGTPGSLTLSRKKKEKIVQFQNSPEKLENGLNTFKSTPEDPYVDFITIQIQKAAKI